MQLLQVFEINHFLFQSTLYMFMNMEIDKESFNNVMLYYYSDSAMFHRR